MSLLLTSYLWPIDYFEDFDAQGQPSQGNWYFTDDMLPNSDWKDFIPGDGYAHITFDADPNNDKDPSYPFQMIAYGTIGPGHRLEMLAKGAAKSGVGGFIFTYMEDSAGVDEIDIEIVPDDTGVEGLNHATAYPDGWTDARFNTWGNSSFSTLEPHTSIKAAVVNENGQKVSHDDGEFHIYTIEWLHGAQYSPTPQNDGRDGRVNFYIDGVYQTSIYHPVPESPSEVLLGVRNMSWTGPLDWPGTHTMLIDWMNIEPIDDESPTAATESYRLGQNTTLIIPKTKGLLINDIGKNLSAELITNPKNGALRLAPDGGFQYTPGTNYIGKDYFVYRADDGTTNGESQAVRVTLEIVEAD